MTGCLYDLDDAGHGSSRPLSRSLGSSRPRVPQARERRAATCIRRRHFDALRRRRARSEPIAISKTVVASGAMSDALTGDMVDQVADDLGLVLE